MSSITDVQNYQTFVDGNAGSPDLRGEDSLHFKGQRRTPGAASERDESQERTERKDTDLS